MPTSSVTMLWIESTRIGSAARTHMDGTRSRLEAAGIAVREQIFSEATAEGLVNKLRRLLTLVRAGRRAAHAGVLVTRWHPFLAFVAPRWRRAGGKILLLVQGNDESTYETNPWLKKIPGIKRMMTQSLRAGSSVLCVNRGLAEWVVAQRAGVGGAVAVMPSGVSDLFFDADPVDMGEPYALFFGGLAPWQGIDYMLAAHESPDWPRGLKLLVIGDGVKADAVRAAQGETLEWLGRKRPEELAGYVAGALVTLCPKSNTGSMARVTTPFKMLESAAAGVPVVATDIPAQVDMLDEGGYGVLVDSNDPADLARAVSRLVADREFRDELVSRAEKFSPRCRWSFAAPQLAAAIKDLQREIQRKA
ncbi:glycosyltransferase family 4 protein [Microbacterium sp. KNMS]